MLALFVAAALAETPAYVPEVGRASVEARFWGTVGEGADAWTYDRAYTWKLDVAAVDGGLRFTQRKRAGPAIAEVDHVVDAYVEDRFAWLTEWTWASNAATDLAGGDALRHALGTGMDAVVQQQPMLFLQFKSQFPLIQALFTDEGLAGVVSDHLSTWALGTAFSSLAVGERTVTQVEVPVAEGVSLDGEVTREVLAELPCPGAEKLLCWRIRSTQRIRGPEEVVGGGAGLESWTEVVVSHDGRRPYTVAQHRESAGALSVDRTFAYRWK